VTCDLGTNEPRMREEAHHAAIPVEERLPIFLPM
jgi:hypothetical protein